MYICSYELAEDVETRKQYEEARAEAQELHKKELDAEMEKYKLTEDQYDTDEFEFTFREFIPED